MNTINTYPRLKISSTELYKKDEVTDKSPAESAIDYFVQLSEESNKREDILSCYRLLEGKLNEKDYSYILNPLNTTVDRYKRFGTTLRNFDIIKPVINLYTGEFGQRFKHIQVLDSNPLDDNDYKEGLNKVISLYYLQDTINQLNSTGLDTGNESIEQTPLEEQVDEYNRQFDENRVITGQEILDYIYYDQDLEDKHQDAYIDWLVSGITCSYKGIFHNDLDYEVVKPWEITFPINSSSNYLEDGAWVVRRQVLHANQILDRWHDELIEEQVKWLEHEASSDGFLNSNGYVQLPTKWISSNEDYNNASIVQEVNGIEVYHVQYRGFKKVGILSYINEIGQLSEMEVSDTYKLNKDNGDISIEWSWISEVREGWKIGRDNNSIYLHVRALPYNRMELNNSSAQKLSYNGRHSFTLNGEVQSLVTVGRSYQLLYNILHYQFEKIINKNKDKIAIIPQGLIPKGVGGWDEEKFMYYAHSNSMMVIDETSPTAGIALQGIKVLDMSLGNFARDMIDLMQSVKGEWWESIGMNRQRYGDSRASDGKAVSEQAIFRSAIISDELNRKFEKFQEKDYAGLLDLSKLAYISGKKAKYVNSEGRESFLSLNPDDAINRLESDYNIHVRNSKKESEKIQIAKEYGFSLGQNGETSQMLELLDSTNFTKTKEIIKKMDEANKRREEAMQQNAQQSQEAIEQGKRESEQLERDLKKYEIDTDYNKAIDVASIKNEQDISNKDLLETDGRNEIETKRMNDHKINQDNKKLDLEKEKLNLQKKNTNN